MDDLTVRILICAAGFVAGLVVGWTSRAARDVRDLRRAVVPDEPKPRRWHVGRTDVVLAVLLVVTLLAAFTSVQTDRRVDRISDCQQNVTAGLVHAVNERTTFTEEAARRNVELQQSARSMVATILDESGSVAQRTERVRKGLQDYADSLAAFEKVQTRAANNRRAFPYPTPADIARCR